jgi:hypothetical protein
MTRAQIIAMQKRIGTAPDGIWGPKSRAACQAHLCALIPLPNPWPASDEVSMIRFYGKPGIAELGDLPVDGLGIEYEGKPVRIIRCHRHIGPSLLRVLQAISAGPHAGILKRYAGCYNYRPMRHGSRMSKHAWGAAIDLDPDHNGNLTPWPDAATMPLEVMEEFAREGWLSAGAFWGRDAMHFQATH